MVEYVDMTPTWSEVLPLFLAAYSEGNSDGRAAAKGELQRMAALADKYVEYMKGQKNENAK